MKSTKIYRQLP